MEDAEVSQAGEQGEDMAELTAEIPVRYKCTGKNCTRTRVVLMRVGEKLPAYFIPCKCVSTMARSTSDHEITRLERAARCRPFNEALGRRMRFCECCEVPLGVMTLRQFKRRYVTTEGLCPVCSGRYAIGRKRDLQFVVNDAYSWGG